MSVNGDSLDTEQVAAIHRRLGRIEQLINVVLENQKHQAAKLERRVDTAFVGVRDRVESGHDEVRGALYDVLERIPNGCALVPVAELRSPANQPHNERLSQEQKDNLLRAVVESLKDEQRWRDAVAAKHGWPVHPNDMELEPEEKKKVFAAWEAGEPPKQEWIDSKVSLLEPEAI